MSTTEMTLAQPVSRCMTDWFVTLDHRQSLISAAKALRDRNIGLLLVTDGHELVGVLSELSGQDSSAPDLGWQAGQPGACSVPGWMRSRPR